MTTTIRLNENIKELLKLKSAETGISQLELANKYILKGLKEDTTPKKEMMSLEEIEELLDTDKSDKDEIVNKIENESYLYNQNTKENIFNEDNIVDLDENQVKSEKETYIRNLDFFR